MSRKKVKKPCEATESLRRIASGTVVFKQRKKNDRKIIDVEDKIKKEDGIDWSDVADEINSDVDE